MDVSIVMPFKDRLNYGFDAIYSVLNQTHKSFELIIVDDGSNEEVLTFLTQVASSNKHVVLTHNAHSSGACGCRNTGLDLARGEYVIFLDSDDILAPFCIKERIEAIQTKPHLDCLAFRCLLFKNLPLDGYIVWNRNNNKPLLDRFLQHDAPFQTSGPIWKKSSLQRLKLRWDETLVGWQDWKFHIEALILGVKCEVVDSIDYFWNQPKKASISKGSHNFAGRSNRMKCLTHFAATLKKAEANRIYASVVWLAYRMPRREKRRAAKLLLSLLKGQDFRFHAAAYMFFSSFKIMPLRIIAKPFKKQVMSTLTDLDYMINQSNTYKLAVEPNHLDALIKKLNEYSNFQKKFW